MVVFQVGFNLLGLGGLAFATALYTVAMVLSSFFHIDPAGLEVGPDTVVDERTRKSPLAYLVRAVVSFVIMVVSIWMWFLVGYINEVETNFESARDPVSTINKMAGSSFLLQMIYMTISHITFFAFCRFWMSIYEMFYAFFLELGEGNGRRGGGRRGRNNRN